VNADILIHTSAISKYKKLPVHRTLEVFGIHKSF